jgi:uncharacterized membrane protein (UPF0127 family)
MRFAIDVVFCDADGRVLHVTTLEPHRLSRPVWRARWVAEAASGATSRWGIGPNDVLRIQAEAPE